MADINEHQFVLVEFRSSKEPHDFVPMDWIYNFSPIRIARNRTYKTYWNSDKSKIAPPECGETSSTSEDREDNKFYKIYFKQFCSKYQKKLVWFLSLIPASSN